MAETILLFGRCHPLLGIESGNPLAVQHFATVAIIKRDNHLRRQSLLFSKGGLACTIENHAPQECCSASTQPCFLCMSSNSRRCVAEQAMTAFSAEGGCGRAATCSATKPAQEAPTKTASPEHHACEANSWTTNAASFTWSSSYSLRHYMHRSATYPHY